ncbi:hypothetical protein [Acinetobacter sp.]|uniref:hypothetical protein n=1 Tax=Acinetobacter sp. TaxID=472 RepID=UPI000C0B4BE2|nr:hypothetical protein [Acinetobacter sp.]MAK30734.1 hypothetical protein [Acinetobacter sp.]|tara:strand:+ start:3071 stop:3601 length:531 start_codon:yes stop_codon:yes gene_type:complete
MYLLNLDRKGDIFKDDDGVTGVPEFLTLIKKEKFGPSALKWVALVYDYESPYRHYNEEERKKAVSKDLYDTFKWAGEKDPTLIAASNRYRELQFDPLDEQLLAFNKKIEEFTQFMSDLRVTEDTAESLQKLMIGIEKILKTRQSLLDAIERRGERQKIAGDKDLSFLERRKEIQEV